ncbi:hypothetical protein FRC14_007508 [Serendipita sp. 396]|nr:hypothetical protein FRC14_007508 [Serendipita sp. 396]
MAQMNLLNSSKILWVLWLWSLIRDATSFGNPTYFTVHKYRWQVQIVLNFILIFINRHHPHLLYLRARSKVLWLIQATECSLGIYLPERLVDSIILLFKRHQIWGATITTISVSRFLLPQATTILTSTCRPLSMPIPQCQDLLYPPSTYLVILWANFGLLCILDKASRSLRVWNRPRCQRDGRLKKLQAEGPPSYLLRLILGIATLYVAFYHPSVRFPGTGTVLFSPATPAISTLSNTLIGGVASVILLLAYDVLGASSLVENVPTASRKLVEHTSMGIHPVTSLSPKRYRVRPKSHTPRRPTLTPETFSPIAPEGTTAGQSKYRPKSAKSPLVPKGETPPLRSQYLLSDKLMAPGDYVDAKDTNMYNEIEPSANTLLPCPHTKPRRLVEAGFEHIIITTEQDPSHEFTEPFVRPGSRLGFSSNRRKYGSIRVIDDEYEMEGAAAGLDMVSAV